MSESGLHRCGQAGKCTAPGAVALIHDNGRGEGGELKMPRHLRDVWAIHHELRFGAAFVWR